MQILLEGTDGEDRSNEPIPKPRSIQWNRKKVLWCAFLLLAAASILSLFVVRLLTLRKPSSSGIAKMQGEWILERLDGDPESPWTRCIFHPSGNCELIPSEGYSMRWTFEDEHLILAVTPSFQWKAIGSKIFSGGGADLFPRTEEIRLETQWDSDQKEVMLIDEESHSRIRLTRPAKKFRK